MVSKRTLHVLVVDCDEPVCTVTTEVLESMGYRAYGNTQSLAALKAFSNDPDKFDLAIIEPAMPEIAGLELATRFRRIRPGFPVLFYGGYADVSLSEQVKDSGFGEITLKPLTSKEMNREIESTLHRSL